MARVQIDMPKTYIFKTELDVRIADINYGNHLGHDAVISLLHEARVRFVNSLGYTEIDIEGKAIVVSDLAVVYKSQSFHRDRLIIEITAGDYNKYGCDIFYRVANANSKAQVLDAKTGLVFFDYSAGKVCRIPEPFISKTQTPEETK